MSTPTVSPRGIVVSIWGKAYIRGADGVWRPLKVGEVVKPSDQLLTEQNGIVQMEPADAVLPPTGTAAAEGVDRAIAALGTREGAPAAGLAGGDGGDLQPGLRVERIVEGVDPLALRTGLDATVVEFGRAAASTGAPELDSPTPVTVGSGSISAVEQGAPIALGLPPPTGGATLAVTINSVPAIGQIVSAGGAVVTAGSVLTPADLAGLRYVPPADYNGTAAVGGFSYTVSNGTSSATGTVTIALAAVNDAPVATAGSASGAEDGTLGVSLAGTDEDGSIAAVRVTTLPANGTLFLADGTTPVAANQALTPAQAAALVFRPAADFNGSASLAFTVTDNTGAVSSPATFALTVTAVNDAPVAVNDSVSTVAGAPVTLAVLANDRDIDGDALRVTGASVSAVLGSVTINANGSLTFTPAPGVSGPVAIGYTIADPSGASSSAVLSVNVAGSPSVTVDAPALTNDNTPMIVGTSNLPPGSTVTLTLTDADGAVQTFTATVQPDGTWSASVPAPLPDGGYSVTADVTAPGGATASASDGGSVDTLAPTITVDAPALGNDATPTITGTTNLPAGSTITLTVTGSNGAVQTFTATVQLGGSYSADVPAPLAEGPFTVVATSSDAAGNPGSASDSGAVDLTPPAATIAIDPVTADNIVNAGEAGSTIAITGTVGGDVRVGDVVTLTVNGVAYAGVVQAGNTFSISVPGAAVLADADRRIDGAVTTSDAAGNSTTATAIRNYAVNTAPTAVADAASVGEDAAAIGGDATPGTPGQDSDADGDPLTVIGVAVGAQPSASGNVGAGLAGAWGTLTLGADGAYTYVPAPAAQALDAGEFVTDTFTYTIADGRGGSATATITVSVVGANDPTTIAGTLAGTVQEDAAATATGALSATDPDVGARGFTPQTSSGTYGTFSISGAGDWTYTLANAAANVQALAPGQSVTETFVVSADDGTTASITVTVNGSNDAPVVSSTSISAVEQGAPVALGLAVPTDVDAGAVLAITVTALPAIGQVQLADGTPVANGAVLTAAQLAGLRFLPPADYDGVAPVGSFGYSVSDGIASVSGGTTITIAAVNDAPVASSTSAGTGENSVLASSVPAATDVDGTIAGYQLVAGPAQGALTFNPGGTYSFNPGTAFDDLAPGATRDVTFTYTATDNNGAVSNVATVTITVTGTNDNPVASTASATTGENSVLASSVPAATDVDGTVASHQLVTGPAQGALTFNSDGTYSFNPGTAFDDLAPGASRDVTFTYTATDNNGGVSNVATVTITVTGTNDNPVATNAAATTGENSVLASSVPAATDVDGTVASYQLVAGPASGTLTFNSDGTYSFATGTAFDDLAPGATRDVTFTYSATDNNGGVSNVATVTITVTGTNDAPVASDASAGTGENSVLNASVPAASDVDGTVASYQLVAGPAQGTLTFNSDGSYAFNPATAFDDLAAGAQRQVSFTYTATDNNGAASNIATVTITVTGTNDAPVANADVASTSINTAIANIDVLANDTDPDTGALLSVQGATVNPAQGTVTVNPDGTINFTPAANVTGPVVISYTLSDGTATTTGTLTVNVGANTAPAGTDASFTINEDTTRSFSAADFGFTDSDLGQTLLAVRIDTLPAAGTLTLGGVAVTSGQVIAAADLGTLVFTPAANANGTPYASFAFSVQDTAGAFDAAPNTLTLNVTPVADAAVIGGVSSGSAQEDVTLTATGALTVTDPDAGEAAFNPLTGSGGSYGSFSVTAGGAWTYTLANASPAVQALAQGQTVTDSFSVTTIDGTSQLVTITITGTNDVPVVSAASATTDENTVLASSVPTATDIDGTVASYQIVTGPAQGSLTFNSNGTYSFSPGSAFDDLAPGATRAVTFTYTATDNNGGVSNVATVTITVTGTNDSPVASSASATTGENATLASSVPPATDVDGTVASYQFVAGPMQGALTFNSDGTYSFNPGTAFDDLAPGATRDVTFTYTATDNNGGVSNVATVTITVTGTNDNPVASSASATTGENSVLASSVPAATDVDGTIASYQLVAGPASGTLTFNSNGTYSFATGSAFDDLAPGATRDVTFTYSATDNNGGVSNVATVTITVTGTNDNPVASNATAATGENTVLASSVPAATDIDGTVASYQLVAGPASGTLTFNSNGSCAFNPGTAFDDLAAGATRDVTFTYTATDNDGGVSNVATVTLTVTGTDDAPVISTGTGSVIENTSPTATGTLTATDVDNPALAFVAGSVAGTYGALSVDAAGAWSYTLGAAAEGLRVDQTASDVLSVTLNDGRSTTVTITITGTNDAPVAVNDGSAGVPALSVAEDSGASAPIAVLANDSDIDGDRLTVTAASSPNGTVTINPDNTLVFTPAANFNGPTTVSYTVSDGNGGTSVASVFVNVTAVNDAPVNSVPGAQSTNEDTSLAITGLSVADVDAGAGTLTVTLTVDNGTLTVAGGGAAIAGSGTGSVTLTGTIAQINATLGTSVSYVPTADFNGGATLTIATNDGGNTGAGGAQSDTDTVTLDIVAVNDAPTLAPVGNGSVAELRLAATTTEAGLGGTLVGADVDAGATLTFGIQGGTVVGSTATLTLAYGTLTVNTATGAYTYTKNDAAIEALDDGESASDVFTVSVSDGIAAPVTRTYTVNITGADDAPTLSAVADGGVAEVANGTSNTVSGLAGTLAGADVDVEALAYGISGGTVAAGVATRAGTYGTLTVDTSTGAYSYAPSSAVNGLRAGQSATDSFTVTVSDGDDALVSRTYTVNLTGANDLPVLSDTLDPAAVAELGDASAQDLAAISGTFGVSDLDIGDTLTPGVVGAPVVQLNGSPFTLPPGAAALIAAGALTLSPATSNGGGTSIGYTYKPAAANLDFLAAGSSLTITYTVQVGDGSGSSDTQDVTFTISGTNDAPVITSNGGGDAAALDIAENSSAVTTVAATDADTGAVLTFSIVGGADAARFAIDASTGALAFVTPPNFDAPTDANGDNVYVVQVQVADGNGGIDLQTINVTVANVNEAPTITSNGGGDTAAVSVAENTSAVTTVVATDPEAAALSYSIVGGADSARFTIDPSTGALTFVSAPDFEAPTDADGNNIYIVQVRAVDPAGNADTQTINVTVTNVNEPPAITSNGGGDTASITVAENTTAVTTVTATDPDAGQTLDFAIVGGADAARFAIDPSTGVLSFIAAPNFEAPTDADGNNIYTLQVRTTDGNGGSDVQTINVTVANVNEAPVIGAPSVTGTEDTARVFSWADFAVVDPESPSGLSITITSLPADGALQFFNTGTSTWVAVALNEVVTQADIGLGRLRFVPDADESGVDGYATGTGNVRADYASFTFTASDGAATSAAGTMRVDITPVADATTITASATTLPATAGLTLTRHDNIAGTQTAANVEAGVENDAIASGPTTITAVTGTETTGAVGSLGADDAYRVSGYIYLNAGQSYSFGGGYGDMLLIELAGQRVVSPVIDGNNNDEEVISSTTFMPAVSGFYSLELIVYNAAGDNGFANVTLNGLALSTANYNLQTSAAAITASSSFGPFQSLTDTGTGGTASMSVAGYYQHRGGSAIQGQGVMLPVLSAGFGDSADNSERHRITLDLSAAPVGTRVFVDANGDGAADDGRVFVVGAGNTQAVIYDEDNPSAAAGGSNWNLSAIRVDPPTSFASTFTVNAISQAVEMVSPFDTTTSTTALSITLVASSNIAPDVGVASASVSEESLAGGLADTSGTPDTTNAATVSGTISITDSADLVADSITSVTLTAPTTALTSNGVAVTWSGAGTGTLTATAGATPIATLTIDTAGNYTFTLQGPIDHPGTNAEDAVALNFGVVASDGVNTGSGTLTMSIEDDQPSPLVPISNFIAGTDTNLLIMLDLSGSMNTADGVDGTTRLASAVASINTLLDRYDEFGAVRVRLVTFADGASAQGTTWVDIATAKATLATLTASGATNYDAPLGTAITAFSDAGRQATGQNVAYFFSDGAPTRGSGDASTLSGAVNSSAADIGIQAAEETLWTNFLNTNAIRAFSIGLGAGVSTTNLNPIAYDGQSSTNSDAVVVASFDDLDNSLSSTIQGAPAGGLAAGGAFNNGGQIGADGGYVASIAIEGSIYTYNPAGAGSVTVTGTNNSSFDTSTNTLTVTTSAGGRFAIDMDNGSYRYSAPDAVPSSFVENVAYTISDRDGDTRSSSITVTVDRTNTIIGSTASETLNGSAAPDYIVGRDGNDVLNGNANNDVLQGNNGNDTLNGGDGNDRLSGGAGNDILTGGLGGDTFEWKLADRGAPGGPSSAAATPIDQITDFNGNAAGAGGDVLDLRDLLQGETSSATLDTYLDFNVVGGHTEIRISSTGAFAGGTYASGTEDQRIVLSDVDIRATLGLAGSATDAQIIAELINRGKLITDVPPGS